MPEQPSPTSAQLFEEYTRAMRVATAEVEKTIRPMVEAAARFLLQVGSVTARLEREATEVRQRQLGAVPGQVECTEEHDWQDGMRWAAVAGIPFLCWKCRAQL